MNTPPPPTVQPSNAPTVETTPRTFHYDPLFGSAPTNATNAAWHSLFPTQGGFFKHPDLAPARSAFAVYHQLHCLVRPAPSILLFQPLHQDKKFPPPPPQKSINPTPPKPKLAPSNISHLSTNPPIPLSFSPLPPLPHPNPPHSPPSAPRTPSSPPPLSPRTPLRPTPCPS